MLAASLSKVLVAITMTIDNEVERRLPHRTARGPQAHSGHGLWLTSLPMWANYLRFVDATGTPVTALAERARLVNVAGLQRWSYVRIEEDLVTLTSGGAQAGRTWSEVVPELDARWRRCDGGALSDALESIETQLPVGLPDYLPVSGFRQPTAVPPVNPTPGGELTAGLSRVLLAWTQSYEERSPVSLVLAANVLRVLTVDGVRQRDLPGLTGLSRESVAGSATVLVERGLAARAPGPGLCLTVIGGRVQRRHDQLTAQIATEWSERFGAQNLRSLETTLRELLHASDLRDRLTPPTTAWRSHPPYRAATRMLLDDPAGYLPEYPAVTHRGGFPDGS